MSLSQIRHILQQGKESRTVEWIYFEGGEPFLYYAALLKGVQEAAAMGFQVGVVSNGYWATGEEDALECLRPFAGLIQDLSVSSDLYHWDEKLSRQAQYIRAAAERLGIPINVINIADVETINAASSFGQLPPGESEVMYRGRAAEKLAGRAAQWPWQGFVECPHEDLRDPGRIHVDPLGNLHVCHGITIGNIFDQSLNDICQTYVPETDPVVGPLLSGGPAELVRRYGLAHQENYADACHLCDAARRTLRTRFPDVLKPDQMYGVL
jgi:MoaA/NifB/PqqE/SkfB family radical SAM enzyme